MNRLVAHAPMSLVPDTSFHQQGAPWLVEEETEHLQEVATFAPAGYEPGYAYPLVVWLHSEGSDENALPQVMPHMSVRNYVSVAPRGVELDGSTGWIQTPEAIAEAEQSVVDAIDAASDMFNVHPERIFLVGSGQGGTMAVRLALQDPGRFAGAVSLDGPLPQGHRPFGRLNDARGLPLLLAASRESQGYPEPQLCSDLALLHSAGFQVAIRQYPGDDELTTAMLADVNRWVMDLVAPC